MAYGSFVTVNPECPAVIGKKTYFSYSKLPRLSINKLELLHIRLY